MTAIESEFSEPHLPPWLMPLSALGIVTKLVRKPEHWEVSVILSQGGGIAMVIPDIASAGAQLARGLTQAGKILASSPVLITKQSELGFADDR